MEAIYSLIEIYPDIQVLNKSLGPLFEILKLNTVYSVDDFINDKVQNIVPIENVMETLY